jgi:hypothetical protein
VAADPGEAGELRVGLLDCTIHSYRPLNVGSDANDRMSGSSTYTSRPLASSIFPPSSWPSAASR